MCGLRSAVAHADAATVNSRTSDAREMRFIGSRPLSAACGPATGREPRRIVNETTGYGDASACLKLRTPLIRRGSTRALHQIACPAESRDLVRITRVGGRRSSFLIDAEVPIDLPRRHVLDVVEPLLPLGGDEVLEKMLAERLAHEVVLLELVERFAQVAGQVVDAQVAPLAVAHREDVLVDRRAGIDLLV